MSTLWKPIMWNVAFHTLFQVCGTSSNNHCSYSSLCCSVRSGDVLENFNLENIYSTYTNCSGRQFCQNVQAPWQLLKYFLPNAVTSTYVQIEYGCQTGTITKQISLFDFRIRFYLYINIISWIKSSFDSKFIFNYHLL